jgi:hypothetical protein
VRPRATTTLILALAAGLAAGCGGDDENGGEPIPADQAAALQRQLESIENRFQFGGAACADITGNTEPNTTAVRSVIDSLPQDVDPDVRDSLEQSFDRLFELVQEQCDTEKGQEEEPAPVDTGPTVPPPEEEEEDDGEEEEEEPTTPPETGPTVTEPPAEVPPETPPGQDGSLPPGQGGGAGNGNSGQGGSGTAGQGGGGGALVPGDVAP